MGRQGNSSRPMMTKSPPWGFLQLENLNLKKCCFPSAHSLQLCLHSPNCSRPYLMVLSDGFCCVSLAFSFSPGRLQDRSAEQQFRHIPVAAALMGLLATWGSASRASDLSTQCSPGVLGAAAEQHALIKPCYLSRVCEGNAAAAALDCRRIDACSQYPILYGTWAGLALHGSISLHGTGTVMTLP